MLAALKLGVHLAWRAGRISDHDAVVGRALANVLAGGSLPHQTTVSEQYLLDLEREAFLKLCGERKTLERIQHTLKTGKPLGTDRTIGSIMDIIDRGSGPPLVLIPGLQGRWEYLRPAVDALVGVLPRAHVLAVRRADLGRASIATQVRRYVDQVDRARRAGIDRATICGVSFGGLIARPLRGARTRRAATRWSSCRRRGRAAACGGGIRSTRALPWLFGPLFLAETPLRLRPEIRAAIPDRARAAAVRAARRCARCCRAPVSLVADGGAGAADRRHRRRGRTARGSRRRRWSSPASAARSRRAGRRIVASTRG